MNTAEAVGHSYETTKLTMNFAAIHS